MNLTKSQVDDAVYFISGGIGISIILATVALVHHLGWMA